MMIRKYVWIPLLLASLIVSNSISIAISDFSIFDKLSEVFSFPEPKLVYAKKDYYVEEENVEKLRENVYLLINAVRMNNSVGKLERDEKLELAAQRHAEDMIERNYLSHYSPEGESVFERLKEVGYNYYVAGENIFEADRLQYLDPINMSKVVVNGWMESKKHKENLLHPAYEEIGIGVAYDEAKKRLVVVADFGSELK
ncbi:SCP-like extracellular [Ferroglobus placidus DSM 10642]|uniref:SCP-like extracellular n=1 Tax=Ferroglobus placidus (strain DSM 10642 / AEDII12DO) TaxID=589924 RepID=D3S2N3_FERPA|nr:CAP domain-containing protein [Ferroglobus placidus]ADC64563.1 SCP-like extracellular [Ferroglobus placidus DSM 10642]